MADHAPAGRGRGNAAREYTTVSRWYAQHLLTKMRGIDEGNGSLLDNSLVL